MSKLIFVILLAVLLPLAAAAQSKEWRGQGYAFVAPTSTTEGGFGLHIGGGGEGLVYKGLGVGGEIGYVGSADGLRDGFGVLSTDISYHFTKATKSRKFAPFVTSGYSMLFRSSAVNSINIGGGANWWFKDRIGLRLELRDHIPLRSEAIHFFGVRIGLAFR
ncbi:MAG TPA: hypothetical protein VJZ77_19420 [Blastocatellia bacterium]|nr:hypothetical protein [Blastocatellia bacterium]